MRTSLFVWAALGLCSAALAAPAGVPGTPKHVSSIRAAKPPMVRAKVSVGAASPVEGELPITTEDTKLPEAYLSIAELRAHDNYDAQLGYHFSKITRGNPKHKYIALTFDDGPHRMYTLKLLQVLKRYHAPATFFVVGKQVEKFPTLVQLEVIEGHEIGNHTYDHVDLTKVHPDRIPYELDHCDDAIRKAVGSGTRFFRPPGGQYNLNVVNAANERRFVTTLWTSDPGDYAKPGADVILQRCLDRLNNGAIYLLHDGMPETISMLPTFIAEARKRGYQFVTLSQLIQ